MFEVKIIFQHEKKKKHITQNDGVFPEVLFTVTVTWAHFLCSMGPF